MPDDSREMRRDKPCPICGKHMAVEDFNGVTIDACQNHGVWLDRGELPAIASRVGSRQRIRAVDAIRKARLDGKISGAMLGAWSLMLD